jgi:hypothetical protein
MARLPASAVLLAAIAVGCDLDPVPRFVSASEGRTASVPRVVSTPPPGALPDAAPSIGEAGTEAPDTGADGHDAGEKSRDGGMSTRDSGLPPRDAGFPHPDAGPWILVGDVVNARDVGGVTAGTAQVVEGALYRGPPLSGLSPKGCDEFARRGIRTVIDLRVDSERGPTPVESCVAERAQVVLAPLPVPYNVSGQDYIAILNTTDSIAAAFHVLGNAASYPVYVNCTWGRDRTGVVIAIVLRALGVSREAIMDEYLLSLPSVGAFPGSLGVALDEVDRRGGIAAYLASIGVTDAELTGLRARTLVPD